MCVAVLLRHWLRHLGRPGGKAYSRGSRRVALCATWIGCSKAIGHHGLHRVLAERRHQAGALRRILQARQRPRADSKLASLRPECARAWQRAVNTSIGSAATMLVAAWPIVMFDP